MRVLKKMLKMLLKRDHDTLMSDRLFFFFVYIGLDPRKKLFDGCVNPRFIEIGTTITTTYDSHQESPLGLRFGAQVDPKWTTRVALGTVDNMSRDTFAKIVKNVKKCLDERDDLHGKHLDLRQSIFLVAAAVTLSMA